MVLRLKTPLMFDIALKEVTFRLADGTTIYEPKSC